MKAGEVELWPSVLYDCAFTRQIKKALENTWSKITFSPYSDSSVAVVLQKPDQCGRPKQTNTEAKI